MTPKLFFLISSCLLFCFVSNAQECKFEAQTIDDGVTIGYGLAVGDVDGDSKPDILLADKKQFVWYRNGDWKRFVMVDSLTQHDNVCIAARDLNGDGKVEVAVGAQWNPGETTDESQSGSVHYLVRPADATQLWKAVALHHEPTVHRMQWVKTAAGKFSLVVVPLHGRGNREGEGQGVKVLAYRFPADVYQRWPIDTLEKTMHLTHNFDVVEGDNTADIYLGGKEGISKISLPSGQVKTVITTEKGVGEVRMGRAAPDKIYIAAIEPMHGNALVVYAGDRWQKTVLDDNLREGHALATGDFFNEGGSQIVAGWRGKNGEGKVGLKLYSQKGDRWESSWIDENGIACEDLKIADLNGDGKPDIVASGRATHNLKIYWNR